MPGDDKIDLSIFLNDYLNDAKEGFQEINRALIALEKEHDQPARWDEIFRVVHTLKSSSTMLEFSNIAELAHVTEDLLDRMRKGNVSITQETVDLLFEVTDTLERMIKERAEGKGAGTDFRAIVERVKRLTAEAPHLGQPEDRKVKTAVLPTIEKIQTVRVRMDLLDALFNLVGELIITKNRIDNIVMSTPKKELKDSLAAMDRIIAALQENVWAARMVPVDEIFQKFPRMVRDLAREEHKEIDLVLEGRDIELDKGVLDAIGEPLLHLLRNAVDHGIETSAERQERQKPRLGTIKLAAKRAENHILIEVADDGRGIDIARMKDVAVKKGFGEREEVLLLPDREVLNLLFRPGFTSVDAVSDLSGRGVGLDVVKIAVERLGGTVEIATQEGQGTRFILQLPLATAIMQTLMVGIGEQVFAIPSDLVLETLHVRCDEVKDMGNKAVLVLRREVIPFVKLSEVLNISRAENQESLVAIIMRIGDRVIALGVDTMLDITENIVKPFDPIAQQFKGFSGGTILGDGRVALLLDIPALLDFNPWREKRRSA